MFLVLAGAVAEEEEEAAKAIPAKAIPAKANPAKANPVRESLEGVVVVVVQDNVQFP